MQVRRKTWIMEKVENLCRTATVQKIMPTRLNKSDHACAIPWQLAAALTRVAIEHRTPQGEDINRQQHQQPSGMPVTPATPRDSSGTIHAAASRLIS